MSTRTSSKLVYYSAILQQDLGPWHYVLQHDGGSQRHAVQDQDAEWYSIVQYLSYQVAEETSTSQCV
jgi:hypothetical protein